MRRAIATPLAMWLVIATAATCKIRMGTPNEGGIDFPCETADTCPPPDRPCLLSACIEGECVYVPGPSGVLPEGDQIVGDCMQLYCDGNGDVTTAVAPRDIPKDDGNACTEAACNANAASQDSRDAGAPCPLGGTAEDGTGKCNGAGKCGVCLPDVRRCEQHAVQTCNADGQWAPPTACTTKQPVCSAAACIGVVELDTGADHACARFDDGSVRCWGNAQQDRLGASGLAGARAPSWASAFTDLRLGHRHQCGRRGDQTVWCWGAGELGQLGNGAHLSSQTPVATGLKALAVDVGDHHGCALVSGGVIKCWGRNDLGQLGVGKAPATPLTTPIVVGWPRKPQGAPTTILGLSDAKSMTIDASHTCITRANGELRCWGLLFHAVAPIIPVEPDDTGDSDANKVPPEILKATLATPTSVAGITDAVELACGGDHCCARHQTGAVSCWGSGAKGALGTGSSANSFKAVRVKGVANASRIAVGRHFGCALSADASVMCWGANDRGQLGTGATAAMDVAKLIKMPEKVQTLSVADEHACALLTSGQLLCWGDNRAGQLGQSGAAMTRVPAMVTWP